MKIIYTLPFILMLAACSSDPTKKEIEKEFTALLQEYCPYASAKDTKIINIIKPNSSNENQVIVSFSTDIFVKFGSDVAKKRDANIKYKEALEKGITRLKNEVPSYDKSLETTISNLRTTRQQILVSNSYGQLYDHSVIPGETNKEKTAYIDSLLKENEKKMHDQSVSITTMANKLIEEYSKETGGLVTYKTYDNRIIGMKYHQFESIPQPLPYPENCVSATNAVSDRVQLRNLGLFQVDQQRYDDRLTPDVYYKGYSQSFTYELGMVKSSNGWVFN